MTDRMNPYQSSYVVVQAEVWVGQEGLLPNRVVDGRLVEPDGEAVAQVVGDRRPENEEGSESNEGYLPTKGSGCSSVVERTPRNREIVGSIPPGCWALFFLYP